MKKLIPSQYLLICLFLLAGALPAQFTLAATDGALGRNLNLDLDGSPGTRFLLFMSTQSGPLPLAIVDPTDPRSLAVGIDLLSCLQGGMIMGSGHWSAALPVPNDPVLAGCALRFQALSFPGTTTIFGPMTHPRGVHVWPAASFEPLTRTLPHKRIYALGIPLPDGRLFCNGGGTGAMLALISGNQTWFFDPLSRTHAPGPAMTVQRGLHTATMLLDGRVLLTGGVNVNNDPLNTVEVYDPVKNSCTAIAGKTSSKRSGHTAALLPGGKVLLAGGLSDMNGQLQALGSIVSSTDIFDPTTNTLTPGPTMRAPRVAHSCLPLAKGRYLLAGGASWTMVFIVKVPTFTNVTGIYDPGTNKITTGPPMNTARGFSSSIQLKDGRFLIVGGAAGNLTQLGLSTTSCEIYDPAKNTFTVTGSLGQPRAVAVLALLADGKVIAAGGSSGNLFNPLALTSTEIYDPVKATWSPGPKLKYGRTGCLQAKLPDGTTTLFGGVGTGISGSAQNTAEILHP